MNDTSNSAADQRDATHNVAEPAAAAVSVPVASAPSARKSPRLPLEFPVIVRVEEANGEIVRHDANTVSVSVNGALISLNASLSLDQRVLLINVKTTQEVECIVRSVREKNGAHRIGVEFALWLPEFWEITFPRQEGDPLPEPAADKQPQQKPLFGRVGPMPDVPIVEAIGPSGTGVQNHLSRLGLSGRKKYFLILAPALVIAALWFAFRSSDQQPAPAAAVTVPLPQEVAQAVPGAAGFHLASAADFALQASAFLHRLGQPVSGKIPGHFTTNGESTAYIMLNNDKSWRVAIVENGQLRCDVRYKSVAIAGVVSREFMRRITWSDSFQGEPDADGLLIVKSAERKDSAEILAMEGSSVLAARPANYEEIPAFQVQ